MSDQEFESLEEYESFIQRHIENWGPARRATLAAAMAERWLPAYEAFSASEGWGDRVILRQCLDAVWAVVMGKSSEVDWSRLSDQIHTVTPHMDDFDANEALCACVIVQYALDCCRREDDRSQAVMAMLSGLEAVRPDMLTRDRPPARWWKQAVLQRELDKQLRLIQHINSLTDLKDAPEALRPFLTDPAIVGEVRPRKSPKTPPAMTNRTAFEIYHRMVQADIRGAARNLDPKQHPDLATGLYLGMWLGRYHRRQELISGGYGALADRTALDLLVAKNRARDRAEQELPVWESSVHWAIDTCYHNVYNGLDVHAVEASHGYGPSLRRLWVEAKRRGLSDVDAWESIRGWAYHQPEAWRITPARRKKSLVALQAYLERPVIWQATGDVDIPWGAEVDGESWRIRLNDFPDELMYSLSVGGKVIGDFHDWPRTWKRAVVE